MRLVIPVFLLLLPFAGCLDGQDNQWNSGAPEEAGVHFFFEEDEQANRYHHVIVTTISEETIYAELMADRRIHVHLASENNGNIWAGRPVNQQWHPSLVVYVRDLNDSSRAGQFLSDQIVEINPNAWEALVVNGLDDCDVPGKWSEKRWMEEVFASILRHEIGHVYGLVGLWWETPRKHPDSNHSTNPISVMYPNGVFSPVYVGDENCVDPLLNTQYDADDLADLERAASMRPFPWEADFEGDWPFD